MNSFRVSVNCQGKRAQRGQTQTHRKRLTCVASSGNNSNSTSTRRQIVVAAPLIAATSAAYAQQIAGEELPPLPSPNIQIPKRQNTTPDYTITDEVQLTVGTCDAPEVVIADTTRSSLIKICEPTELLGTITIGLYGNLLPVTVNTFKQFIKRGLYTSSAFNRIVQGQFISAGKQGYRTQGLINTRETRGVVTANTDEYDPVSYNLSHNKAGLVSWCVLDNDDLLQFKQESQYIGSQFLITTDSAPQLDDRNYVIGKVTSGLQVVQDISVLPTIKPQGIIQAYNKVAELLGDDRAKQVRQGWTKPRFAPLIVDAKVTKEKVLNEEEQQQLEAMMGTRTEEDGEKLEEGGSGGYGDYTGGEGEGEGQQGQGGEQAEQAVEL